jgi:preprotein translocase subunit SecY
MLFVARVGSNIPVPGLDPAPLQAFFADQTAQGAGSLIGLYNMFTGGALLQGAICALGVMPYISASIIFQLMAAVVPSLARLQQEGDVGRQKLVQYTRYATLLICLVQGALLIVALEHPQRLFGSGYHHGDIVVMGQTWFLITSIIFLTAGTMLLMWLGEQITQRGVGNGVSLLITIGILADMPGAIAQTYRMFNAPEGTTRLGPEQALLMLALLFIVVAAIVAITQATRKIPVQYAKRVVGRKVYGGQSSYLPLKVNYSGVMPVIFGSALLMFPSQIFTTLGASLNLQFLSDFGNSLAPGSVFYYIAYAMLILFFSYFWVSVMFKPIQIADDLKKYGGYIPGVRPGEHTAKFLDFVMTRLTLFGAIFLTVIAILPDFLSARFGIPPRIATFFGGTGMLITVGVILDTMRQIETFLLQRHYDGFLKKGRIRGRSEAVADTTHAAAAAGLKNAGVLYGALGALFLIGILAWAFQ